MSRKWKHDWRTWVLLVAFSFVVVGCKKDGPAMGTVQGKVTVGGKPLTLGTIFFNPTNKGRSAIGKINTDGTYQLSTRGNNDGAAPGDYIVTIDAVDVEVLGEEPVQAKSFKEELAGVGAVENAAKSRAKNYVSRKYAEKSTSPLKATVRAGEVNTFDFDVTK